MCSLWTASSGSGVYESGNKGVQKLLTDNLKALSSVRQRVKK
jgi:hypothetical protein